MWTFDYGDGYPLTTCDACGRARAQRVGIRLPLSHEHATSKRVGRGRTGYRVTLRRTPAGHTVPCSDCQGPTTEELDAFRAGE